MESVPGSLTSGATPPAASSTEPAGASAGRTRRLTPSDERLNVDGAVRARLGLQRRAPSLLVRHFLRAARRVTVLAAVDLGSFWATRSLLRAVRDQFVLGSPVAGYVGQWLPRGTLSGWQFAAALLVGLSVMGTYGPAGQRRDPKRLFFGVALATALPLWMSIWTSGLAPVVAEYVFTTLLIWVGVGLGRFAVQKVVARVLGVGHEPFRTLFVGPAEACRAASQSPAFANPAEHLNVGFVDTGETVAADALGPAKSVAELLHRSHAEFVVICGHLSDRDFDDLLEAAFTAGCELLEIPRQSGALGLQPRLTWRGGQAFIQLSEPRLRGWQIILKRFVDVVGSLVGLVVASPVMAAIAVAVKLDSRGPVLFRQARIGAGGRRFEVLKFRTMVDGASDEAHRAYVKRLQRDDTSAAGGSDDAGPVFKLIGDRRVTRLGRWLRGTSLDELPQLINVLRGDMSLVGPRPPLAYEVEAYEYWQFERLGVKPGITGLWQVSGRNRLTYRQMCELDAEYVRTWSPLLDTLILLRTVPVVVTNSGRAS